MEEWASRIHERMTAAGRKPVDLARACKIKPGSVSGWFGQGKPTKMISGDNLVAAASFLNTTAEYIMTGRGAADVQSQPAGLDLGKLSTVLAVVEGAIKDSRKRVPPEFKASMIQRVYDSPHALTVDTAAAVRSALAGILETVGSD